VCPDPLREVRLDQRALPLLNLSDDDPDLAGKAEGPSPELIGRRKLPRGARESDFLAQLDLDPVVHVTPRDDVGLTEIGPEAAQDQLPQERSRTKMRDAAEADVVRTIDDFVVDLEPEDLGAELPRIDLLCAECPRDQLLGMDALNLDMI
jgi:hypothetical protein